MYYEYEHYLIYDGVTFTLVMWGLTVTIHDQILMGVVKRNIFLVVRKGFWFKWYPAFCDDPFHCGAWMQIWMIKWLELFLSTLDALLPYALLRPFSFRRFCFLRNCGGRQMWSSHAKVASFNKSEGFSLCCLCRGLALCWRHDLHTFSMCLYISMFFFLSNVFWMI